MVVRRLVVSALTGGALAAVLVAQTPIKCPSYGALVESDFIRLIAGQLPEKRLQQWIDTCGVGVTVDAAAEDHLRAAGATDAMLAAIRAAVNRKASTPPPVSSPRSGATGSGVSEPGVIKWANIPAGMFDMGCVPGDTQCHDFARARHTVTISLAFQMMTTEATVGQFRGSGVPLPAQPEWNRGTTKPVVGVTPDEARAFCAWAGGRLPTDEEWEYAARGGRSEAINPWGNEAPTCQLAAPNGAQFSGCGSQTVTVGSFAPNGYGLYDMAGNVREWVLPRQDPLGPFSDRWVRGGAWDSDLRGLRASNPTTYVPLYRDLSVGVRCARDVVG